jgi:hypothetical protein
VAHNPFKYGTITKVPKFVLEKDFIKNTPYKEPSDENDIPFWAWMPFHLKCIANDEDHLEPILAYMYQSKQFQRLFRVAAFYYKNPGPDASAGERSTLVGILMRHIAMVQSMGHVYLKGLYHLDCCFPLTKFDSNEPDKVSGCIDCSVRELKMEKRIHGTKVLTLIAQTSDRRWAGYYCYGVGNNAHRGLA